MTPATCCTSRRPQYAIAAEATARARTAFEALGAVSDEQISSFFDGFAARLGDADVIGHVLTANRADVEAAERSGRSTTRLVLTDRMRGDMVAGLIGWRDSPLRRDARVGTVEHDGWRVDARRAPLGVVGFVFEGRPNVFADAAGVVRSGNTVVMRIGSDALATAEAIVERCVAPALAAAGLPAGTIELIRSRERAAGWALFAQPRLALAVARGSGPAVAQLGAVARQCGTPVSLHGTGGAWLVAGAARRRRPVRLERDRVARPQGVQHAQRVLHPGVTPRSRRRVPRRRRPGRGGARDLGAPARRRERLPARAGGTLRVHGEDRARADGVHDEPAASPIDAADLAIEWEWEGSPEVSLAVVADVADAVALFNRHSPRFIASIVTEEAAEHDRFYAAVDAPFVGDGFTRWVDGQFALDTPELGLSSWQAGRLMARGGVLSGESVYTVRHIATIADPALHR